MPTVKKSIAKRPQPPGGLFDGTLPPFYPAPELDAWVRAAFLDEESPLYNPEHSHLNSARMGYLWSASDLWVRGSRAAAFATLPTGMGSKFDRDLREMQMLQWFGHLWSGRMPDFLLVFDAHLARAASDRTFVRRTHHELCHCGQAKDRYGVPLYTKKPYRPKFKMRPHDHEVFTSEIKLFGARETLGDAAVNAVLAAELAPEVADEDIRLLCGTCAAKV